MPATATFDLFHLASGIKILISCRMNDGEVRRRLPDFTKADAVEIYLLILHFLRNSPCQGAAAALQKEIAQHGLFPSSNGTLEQQLVAWQCLPPNALRTLCLAGAPMGLAERLKALAGASALSLEQVVSRLGAAGTGGELTVPKRWRELAAEFAVLDPDQCYSLRLRSSIGRLIQLRWPILTGSCRGMHKRPRHIGKCSDEPK